MRKRISPVQVLGALLLLLGLGALIAQQLLIRNNTTANENVTQQIRQILPEGSTGTMVDYSSPEMPVLQLEDTDYVCLLEVPTFGLELSIHDQWDPGILTTQPSRFWGSIYDGTLILGGSNHEGQFAFCSLLDVGDPIHITDMQGTQFRYRVEKIQRSASADFEVLSNSEYPLTLFVRERYENRYIIVRCVWDY